MAETEEHVEGVKDAGREMERAADEMSEHGERLGAHIEGAKKTLQQAQEDDSVPTASSDWEDSEPDEDDDGDAGGFDDPEDLDVEDDDDYEDDDE
jgi:hypothetical protein